jgi:hypothetical protein
LSNVEYYRDARGVLRHDLVDGVPGYQRPSLIYDKERTASNSLA